MRPKIDKSEKADFWDESRTLSLIKKFNALPILWDPEHEHYRSKPLKAEAFEDLAHAMKLTKKEVQRKLHNLRTQFNTEVRKQMNQSGKRTKSSSWKYFDAMKFVAVSNPNQTKIKISDPEDSEDDDDNDNTMRSFKFTSFPDSNKPTPRSAEKDQTIVELTSFEDQSSTRVFRRQSVTLADLTDDHHKNNTKNVITLEPVRDDHLIFGEFVASELRSLDSDYKRKRLRLAIQKAIIEVNELP